MRGQKELYKTLSDLKIEFEYREHPPVFTIEEATKHWKGIDSGRCKNIFLRNHKGSRHYLVILEHLAVLNMRDLEQRLHQGKLSFASEKRLMRYLGVKPGSVSPFGLVNDADHHVHLFIDKNLADFERLSFHPNDNSASIVVSRDDLFRFIDYMGNSWDLLDLYD